MMSERHDDPGHPPRRLPLAIAALAIAATSDANAAVVPGDLLVAEAYGTSVVNIAGGGDFAGGPRFATGLSQPSDLCLGPGDDVYVLESSGAITIITDGGDFTAAPPFAFGLSGPTGIECTPERILVVEYSTGEVTDATLGGDLADAPAFAFGLSSPHSILIDADETVWVTGRATTLPMFPTAIWNITEGGDFTAIDPYASHSPGNVQEFRGLTQRGDMLLVGEAYWNDITDFTTGELFAQGFFVNCYVGLNGAVMGLEDAGALGLFVSGYDDPVGGVFEISAVAMCPDGQPYATGFAGPVAGGMLYIRGTCGDGELTPEEYCDDAGESAQCNDDCSLAACGDGKLNIAAGEDCDDGNVEDGDDCPAGCVIEQGTTGGSSSDESGTTLGESSDGATSGAMDSSSGTEDGSTSTTMSSTSTSTSTSGAATAEDGSETGDDSAAQSEDGGGCGCRSGGAHALPFALLSLVAGRRRRARPSVSR
jgi:cysteine-rich repeat protein